MQDKVAPADGGVVNPISVNMDEVARYWVEEAEEGTVGTDNIFQHRSPIPRPEEVVPK